MAEKNSWKKPDDIMRQLREKKKALQARFQENSGHIPLSSMLMTSSSSPGTSITSSTTPNKRKNPFRRSPVKKSRTGASPLKTPTTPDVALDPDADSTLFHLLNGHKTPSQPAAAHYSLADLLRSNGVSEDTPAPEMVDELRVDWSLKTKVRFTSKSPFYCGSTLKTSEEASGITGFVRCVPAGSSDHWTSLDTSTNAQIHQCCLYWQHPHLPWLRLFPRNTITSVSSVTQSCNIGLDEGIRRTLLQDWCESLRSLFCLLRARQCSFFYVCSHQFTVLFRAAGIGGMTETHALLTPSTKGLRESLTSEDIAFSMPLQQASKPNKSKSDASHEESGSEDEMDDDWIKDIEIQPNLRLQLEAERRNDGGQSTTTALSSDSLLLIQGVETQALFNWLLSTKTVIPSSGPLVGVPPTLLAPVAFHNATLRPLKTRQTVVKQEGQSLYSLELLGPVLPSSLVSLCRMLGNVDFTVSWSTLPGTEPLTRFQSDEPSVSSAFNKESLTDCGLEPQVLEVFCATKVAPVVSEFTYCAGNFQFSK